MSRKENCYRVELSFLVDASHPLVKLGGRINWTAFEEHLAPTYHINPFSLPIPNPIS